MNISTRPTISSNVPGIKSYAFSSDEIKSGLEQIAKENFEYFSPRSLSFHFLGNFAMMEPDSNYGVRVDLAKKIIAASLYSGELVYDYFNSVSTNLIKDIDQKKELYDSNIYKIRKAGRIFADGIRKKIGLDTKYSEDYLTGNFEKNELEKKRIVSKAYEQLSVITNDISQDLGILPVEEIIELVEVNTIFSEFRNGTGYNVTFSDLSIRNYADAIQQQIHRVWMKGVIKDQLHPLSADELFPLGKNEQLKETS